MFINPYYIKIYTYVTATIATLYQLLNIYLIHRFSQKSIQIPEVLPEFLINWLKEFEILSDTKESVKEFTRMCYFSICIYIIFIILATLLK